MQKPFLLPPPQRLTMLDPREACSVSAPERVPDAALGSRGEGAYALVVGPGGCVARAAGEAGFFYAERTFAQLAEQFPEGIPAMEIEDWPDYAVRGFYHDVTRGKVPTLGTLLGLAETCARYKFNHLELYIEHTFAFRCAPEVWQGADPLTPEEILELDARCAELHVDLVPSFTSFGHFYPFLRVPRFAGLNELEVDAPAEPFRWWDRMAHYTLDPGNPGSIALVREIIGEVAPLFRSRYFNVCADETFDLGKGKSRARAEREGVGKVYADFLLQIFEAVREHGKTPMFWGDIVGKHPECVPLLPRDVVALDWDYGAELRDSKAGLFRDAGFRFYVCPGTQAWKGPLPDLATAARNIAGFARRGAETGAAGYLLTDWGDYGHVCPLGLSLPGLAHGASVAWNTAVAADPFGLEEAISRVELGDPTGRIVTRLREASEACRASWNTLALWKQPRASEFGDHWFDEATGIPNGAFKCPFAEHAAARATLEAARGEIAGMLEAARPRDALVAEEILVGLEGAGALEALHMHWFARAGRAPEGAAAPGGAEVAGALREFAEALERVWHRRNKPSEFFRIAELLEACAADCEGAQPSQ